MNIVTHEIDTVNSTITVQIEKNDYQEKVENALRSYRQKANIPGFRKGNVPLSLIKKMYGKVVLGETINELLSENLSKYIQEKQFKILGNPIPSENQAKIDFDNEENFDISFDIAFAPQFELDLKKEEIPYYKILIDDKMVENEIQRYTNHFGKTEIDQDLFDKVYGEGVVKSEEEFKQRIHDSIASSIENISENRFKTDAYTILTKKFDNLPFPETFLKRLIDAELKEKQSEEESDKLYLAMLENWKWIIIRNKIVESYEITINNDDLIPIVQEVALNHWMKQGIFNVSPEEFEASVKAIMQNEKAMQSIVLQVEESKIFDKIKSLANLSEQKISFDDFKKLKM